MTFLQRRPTLPLLVAAAVLLVISVPTIAHGMPSAQAALDEALRTIFRQEVGDAEVVAVVDGVSITRGALRGATVVQRTNNAGLSDADARRAAFRSLARDAVAQAEARRRGLAVSRDAAERFTGEQRRLYQQADPQWRAPVQEQIRSSGLTEDTYWRNMIDAYASLLTAANLREQLGAPFAGLSHDERRQRVDALLDELLVRATIDYRDPTLRL